MAALPESFDVAKRIGLFIYIARNVDRPSSLQNAFSAYGSCLEELQDGIANYRKDCANHFAKKRFVAGLVSRSGLTSFSKYLRMGHWLGFFEFDVKRAILQPNWLTRITKELSEKSNFPMFSFEMPSALKLLSTYLLIERDRNLTLPLVMTIRKLAPSCQKIETNEFRFEYAKNLTQTYSDILREYSDSVDYPNYVRRYESFKKITERLEGGQEPSRSLEHIIEPRINWLIDLVLIDPDTLCSSGALQPLDIWDSLDSVSHKSFDDDAFFRKYIDYVLKRFGRLKLPDSRSGPEAAVDLALGIMKKEFGDLVLIDAALILAWLLHNCAQDHYLTFNEVLQEIERNRPVYSRKMGGLGFVRV